MKLIKLIMIRKQNVGGVKQYQDFNSEKIMIVKEPGFRFEEKEGGDIMA